MTHTGATSGGSPTYTFSNHKLKVFSGQANVPLAEKIALYLGDSLGKVTLSRFPDGEISLRIEEDVRGATSFSCSRPARQ